MTSESGDAHDTVPLMFRVKTDLHQELKQSARMRRASLNQEIVDRLSYVRERKGLLAEAVSLGFGERLAGLLLALGLAMSRAAYSHRRIRSGGASQLEWTDDPTIFNAVVDAGVALLEALRPAGGEVRPTNVGQQAARDIIAAIRGEPGGMGGRMPPPSAKDVEVIQDLLGPIRQRLVVHDGPFVSYRFPAEGEQPANAPEEDVARRLDAMAEMIEEMLALFTRRAGEASGAAHEEGAQAGARKARKANQAAGAPKRPK